MVHQLLYYIQRKIFFRRSFFLYSPCPNLMRSSTSSEDSQLVRIAVPCAQTRVAIEMHSRTNGTKRRAFREACSAGHRASSEARDEVCSLSEPGGRFAIAVAEFEQLLLTCIEGCGLRSHTNRFKVRAAAASWHAHCTLTYSTAREMRFSRQLYCIPEGHGSATLFTRPFLPFCIGGAGHETRL